jgi:hypothetical protein
MDDYLKNKRGLSLIWSEGMRFVLFMIGALAASAALAQQKPQAIGFPDAPGKETLLNKCFQCHSPGMWMDYRADRREWESVLYRMVGRGANWSEEEIKQMADYLGNVYGRKQR